MEFEQIYEAYFSDVFRYIRLLPGDEHVAEEITAETFFKAMRSIDKFRGDCEVRVWLCQIARNSYLSHLKKAGRAESVEPAALWMVPDPDGTPEEQVLRWEEGVLARRALRNLPEPYGEVVRWRVFARLNFREIGQIFGKTENWACVTYHRARAMLKSRMEGENHEK